MSSWPERSFLPAFLTLRNWRKYILCVLLIWWMTPCHIFFVYSSNYSIIISTIHIFFPLSLAEMMPHQQLQSARFSQNMTKGQSSIAFDIGLIIFSIYTYYRKISSTYSKSILDNYMELELGINLLRFCYLIYSFGPIYKYIYIYLSYL